MCKLESCILTRVETRACTCKNFRSTFWSVLFSDFSSYVHSYLVRVTFWWGVISSVVISDGYFLIWLKSDYRRILLAWSFIPVTSELYSTFIIYISPCRKFILAEDYYMHPSFDLSFMSNVFISPSRPLKWSLQLNCMKVIKSNILKLVSIPLPLWVNFLIPYIPYILSNNSLSWLALVKAQGKPKIEYLLDHQLLPGPINVPSNCGIN